MKDLGIIRGSLNQAQPLIVGVDTVYVHTDIQPVETEYDSEVFQYHEIQYDKDEYIQLLSEKSMAIEKELNMTQMAMCNMFEILG